MAMIECWECGRKISDAAIACPGCGAPKRTEPDQPSPAVSAGSSHASDAEPSSSSKWRNIHSFLNRSAEELSAGIAKAKESLPGAGDISEGISKAADSISASVSSWKEEASQAKPSQLYDSLSALKPIEALIVEAGAAINDKARTAANSGISELAGGVAGAAVGGAAGAAALSAGAASGTAGAAALTSGLSTLGGVVGGGMLSGIAVAALPAVALAAGGVYAVGRYNRQKLVEAKELLLQEALRKRDALMRELQTHTETNRERTEYLSRLVAQLQGHVEKLQADLELA
jgi:hypothetical protein